MDVTCESITVIDTQRYYTPVETQLSNGWMVCYTTIYRHNARFPYSVVAASLCGYISEMRCGFCCAPCAANVK